MSDGSKVNIEIGYKVNIKFPDGGNTLGVTIIIRDEKEIESKLGELI